MGVNNPDGGGGSAGLIVPAGNVISDPSSAQEVAGFLYCYSPGNAGWVRVFTANSMNDTANGANLMSGAQWLWDSAGSIYRRYRSGNTSGDSETAGGAGITTILARNGFDGGYETARSLGHTGTNRGTIAAAPQPSTGQTATAPANTATTITLPSLGGTKYTLTMLLVSWTASAPAAGTLLTIQDGGGTVFSCALPAALGPFSVPLPAGGIGNTTGNSLVVTVAAGGGTAVSALNIASQTG